MTVTVTQSNRINREEPIPLGQDASMRILHAGGADHPNLNENTLVGEAESGHHAGAADGRHNGEDLSLVLRHFIRLPSE